jgi:hypothetical protein
MGTRGCYGFVKNGVEKVSYNHSDSYPTGLGQNIVDFVNSTSIEEMNKIFDTIELVDEDEEPTDEHKVELKLTGRHYDSDWYTILRDIQGDLNAYKKGERFMIDNGRFIYSRSCQYAYIINLDENVLEVYDGVEDKKCNGRYGKFQTDLYPRLVDTFPLDNIPSYWLSVLQNKVNYQLY